ncbi:hypothetical protein F751_2784 [Auxenochlorella protothecoides]|uniref:Uncharacterized protein n=1 Tax=Auxenochlorella protothecoides TaxID=3075 RepID=A0A087SPY9_AUXPR|nr:hypothetical protein F751_2784 [Auxenochlorella protothecoides]KFM27793.1 hypothetical protein F751_2784 [Auxenochlorella protothecoides]
MQDKSILLENPVKAKSKGGGTRQTAKCARRQGGTLSAAALTTVTYLGLLPVHALWRAYAERLAARDPGVTLQAYRDRLLGAEVSEAWCGGTRQTAKCARRQGGTLSAAALATVTYLGLLPVHALWRAYAERLAARDPGVTLQAYRDRLLGAEVHGALVRVKACATRPDAAGLTGIVALSRPHSLVLVTPGDRRIRIPRQNSTLELLMGTRLVALEYGEDVGQG